MKPAHAAVSTRFALWMICLLGALAVVPAADGAVPSRPSSSKGPSTEYFKSSRIPASGGRPGRRSAVGPSDRSPTRSSTSRRPRAGPWRSTGGRSPRPSKRSSSTVFSDLLERAYIAKIELYGGERIQYPGERIEGDFATVSTRLITKKGIEVPIDYRMLKRGDRWRVYDVSIEGVSLVANYRTQFNSVIRTSSYDEPPPKDAEPATSGRRCSLAPERPDSPRQERLDKRR